MPAVATRPNQQKLARPLKVLVPLIQQDLADGDRAGREYYRRAGEKLLEARESKQIPPRGWTSWLRKNFALSRTAAWIYMQYAEGTASVQTSEQMPSLIAVTGSPAARDRLNKTGQWRPIREFTRAVPVNDFKQEQQKREEEVRLHREIAVQLVDIGFRALATRLHPDRGGSKDAMVRLNRVRDELKAVAETRTYL